jgi:hypothetical protein
MDIRAENPREHKELFERRIVAGKAESQPFTLSAYSEESLIVELVTETGNSRPWSLVPRSVDWDCGRRSDVSQISIGKIRYVK